jgi:hypothetical protein
MRFASKWKPRLFGKIIAAAVDSAHHAARDEERMVGLLVEAFGAQPEEIKRLEKLAKTVLTSQRQRLRAIARAPICAAELESEVAHLIEEAGNQRRARAAKYRRTTYEPPLAKRTEFGATPQPDGTPLQPLPDGYRADKDLSVLAGLTEKQRYFAQEFIGRPLGPITVWPPGAASPRVVDLAQMWSVAAARSEAVTAHLNKAKTLMEAFEAKSKESARLLGEARAAQNAGQTALAATLRAQVIEAANLADVLRRNAKKSGDAAYGLVRNAFWKQVHSQPDLVAHFKTNMNLQFLTDEAGATRGVPFLDVQGRREGLTLEHLTRRNDDPRLAIEPGNLIVSPYTENVLLNEAVRRWTPLEWR